MNLLQYIIVVSESLQDKFNVLLIRNWMLILTLITVFAFYYYCTATLNFFKKKGVAYMKPIPLIGNSGPRITGKLSHHEYQNYIYNYFKGERYGGYFDGRKPLLYVFDPDLIKAVTIRNFDHFVDRVSLNLNVPRYLKRSLLKLKGREWKGVRSTMTPVFSSARLKNMVPLLELCSKQMVEYLKEHDENELELKSVMGRYTLEVIGACAFGIKYDAVKDKNCHFIKMAEQFDYLSRSKRIMGRLLLTFMPKLLRFMKFSFLNLEAIDELMKILHATKAERRSTDAKKSDFLQILLDVTKEKHTGTNTTVRKYMDEDTIDAQCLLFLLAGYETSSTLLSFTIHTLATQPEIQEKLRAHIMEMTEGKQLTYELLKDLDYLEGVLLETLRVYPPSAKIDRVVTKPYTFPGSKVQVDVGDVVCIPVYAIHRDPDYYPKPHEFKPERFMGEEKKARPSHLFLAFGAGPRNCLGLRFAMISAKMSMVYLMKNFKFTKCSKTEDPIIFHKRSLLLKPNSGLWVCTEKL